MGGLTEAVRRVVTLMEESKDTGSVAAWDSLLVAALMSRNAELVKQLLKCLDNSKIALNHFDGIKPLVQAYPEKFTGLPCVK